MLIIKQHLTLYAAQIRQKHNTQNTISHNEPNKQDIIICSYYYSLKNLFVFLRNQLG